MILTRAALAGALFAALPVAAALAQAPAPAAPAVTDAWSRATPPGATVGAVYLSLLSRTDNRLLQVTTPVAAKAEVHEMAMDGPVMRMREVTGGLPLPAGTAVVLKPGGLHVMLTGLTAPLKAGDRVPLHLVFQSGPAEDVVATVGTIGASGPGR